MRPFPWIPLLIAVSVAGCATTGGLSNRPPSAAETGLASYYDSRHQGNATASGARYDETTLTAAHRTLPFGTRVRVTNLGNDRSVELTINDRGPFVRGRIIDVSRRAARDLGFLRDGTAKVRVEVMGG